MLKVPPLFHGGVPGRWLGEIIIPGMAEHRYHEGCPHCEAQRRGEVTGLDPATPAEWVYATTDLGYARWYASRAGNGTLYEVRLEGDVERSEEDEFPTWRARRAVVTRIRERDIRLTHGERRALFIRWGGTGDEYAAMVADVTRQAASNTRRAP